MSDSAACASSQVTEYSYLKYIILTGEDKSSVESKESTPGLSIEKLIKDHKGTVLFSSVLSTNENEIKERLRSFIEPNLADIIVTIGFSQSGVVPDAIIKAIDCKEQGFATGLSFARLGDSSHDELARAVCGLSNRVLVKNLSGNFDNVVCGVSKCNRTLVISLPEGEEGGIHCLKALFSAISYASAFIKDRFLERLKPIMEMEENSASIGNGGMKSKVTLEVMEKYQQPVINNIEDHEANKVTQNFIALNVNRAVEKIDIRSAVGRVLAEDVISKCVVPELNESVCSGYGLVHNNIATRYNSGSDFNVVDYILDPSSDVSHISAFDPKKCVRVSAGAPLPKTVDTVHACSENSLSAGTVYLSYAAFRTNVRLAGSLFNVGNVIAKAGSCLKPTDVRKIRLGGVTEIAVYEKPLIAIVSTKTMKGGRYKQTIVDANHLTLIGMLEKQGFDVIDVGIVENEPTSLFEKFSAALSQADAIVSICGAAAGETDYIRPVLQTDFGASVHFGSVNMKPQSKMYPMFASIKWEGHTKIIFVLPNNPPSVVISSILFVIPALHQRRGHIEYSSNKMNVQVNTNDGTPIKLDHASEYFCAPLLNVNSNLCVKYKGNIQQDETLSLFTSQSVLVRLPPKSSASTQFNHGACTTAILLRDFL